MTNLLLRFKGSKAPFYTLAGWVARITGFRIRHALSVEPGNLRPLTNQNNTEGAPAAAVRTWVLILPRPPRRHPCPLTPRLPL